MIMCLVLSEKMFVDILRIPIYRDLPSCFYKLQNGRFWILVYANAHTNHQLHATAITNGRSINRIFADLLGKRFS
ncbi:hypothetical protein D3C87_353060 [compost metagenome]